MYTLINILLVTELDNRFFLQQRDKYMYIIFIMTVKHNYLFINLLFLLITGFLYKDILQLIRTTG